MKPHSHQQPTHPPTPCPEPRQTTPRTCHWCAFSPICWERRKETVPPLLQTGSKDPGTGISDLWKPAATRKLEGNCFQVIQAGAAGARIGGSGASRPGFKALAACPDPSGSPGRRHPKRGHLRAPNEKRLWACTETRARRLPAKSSEQHPGSRKGSICTPVFFGQGRKVQGKPTHFWGGSNLKNDFPPTHSSEASGLPLGP